MKVVKDFLLKDWPYKLIALFMGFSLWAILNFGGKITMSLEKPIEVFNPKEGYTYKLDKKRVRVRLHVVERFISEEMIEKIRVGIDVKGLEEGEYVIKIQAKNLPRFVASVEKVEPDYVRVKVLRAPNGGK